MNKTKKILVILRNPKFDHYRINVILEEGKTSLSVLA